jgi:hypothetical protein
VQLSEELTAVNILGRRMVDAVTLVQADGTVLPCPTILNAAASWLAIQNDFRAFDVDYSN